MIGKVKDFFKKGEFYTHLHDSLESINRKINNNSSYIKKLINNDTKLAQELSLLRQENQYLKERLQSLEDKIWNVFSTARTDGVTANQEKNAKLLESSRKLPK
ncbi:hypothetical protein J1N51_00575 [Psychrosphaera ytuae]|uniref:Uncharacterized protein n=1 Tax=Psychrosphaera ytuae TaxID=2820710 RepID=A0A975DBW7_9GAMM|nr:hypothetical protein [Psychrosphaera ytuae]QTH64028.1 hypothetical protein J1N51_00575 [Psychrosphaera ytuae]